MDGGLAALASTVVTAARGISFAAVEIIRQINGAGTVISSLYVNPIVPDLLEARRNDEAMLI